MRKHVRANLTRGLVSPHRALWLVLVTVPVLGSGCGLDFNEAIPCEYNEQCPEGFYCDDTVARCIAGAATGGDEDMTAVDDTGPVDDAAVADVSGEDTQVADSAPVDTGGAVDTSVDDTGSTDEPEMTVDTACGGAETCNGLDDDCNEMIDDGIDCGSCTNPTAQALVVRVTGTFCMDRWEVSRPDASNFSGGTQDPTMESPPRVEAGLIPWAGATIEEATGACTLLGRRICTGPEWVTACSGPQERALPYGQTSDDYVGNFCNGFDRGQGAAFPAQGHPNCITPDGVYDLSGNLAEWAGDGQLHGGSFEDVSGGMLCTSGRSSNTALPDDEGFRCCSAPM